jgi:hypothetical protein
VYKCILYTTYTSYMFRPLMWPSSGMHYKGLINRNITEVNEPIWMYNEVVSHTTHSYLDIRLAVHHSITFLLLPTWYTNFLFIYTNYLKLNYSTCFVGIPPIIRRSTTQILHMQPLVSSLSVSDSRVQPLREDSGCTRQSLTESDDTRGCICKICVLDLLMMGGMPTKHVEEFNLT